MSTVGGWFASGMSLLLFAASCRSGGSLPEPVPVTEAGAVVLSELPFAELELPSSSRVGAPPLEVPIRTQWRYVGESRQKMHKWATELPIRPRGLFFNKVEPGMALKRGAAVLRYDRFGKTDEAMWVHDRRELVVYLPEKGDGPAEGEFVLSYPTATERECELNLECWEKLEDAKAEGGEEVEDPAARRARFAWTTASDGWNTRRGLLLPAPSVASWDLTVPAGAEFRFLAGIEEPEVKDGPPSDGARLVVEVEVDGAISEVAEISLTTTFATQHVDLSPWAGRQIRLRVRSSPGESNTFDYVFVAEPLVASRVKDPVRVVMVFIDTLRPDHMSMYGYARDTTAAVDHLAAEGVVFNQARSVAPWTLPSARSIITGRDPEDYQVAQTLPELFHEQGWPTAFFAGNVYLSHNFDMTRDWDFHRVKLWPQAKETTDDALAWLEDHEGHHQLLQVHYMSAHLPYAEPDEYRNKYAGAAPDTLRNGFMVSDVRKAGIASDPEAQKYVIDRYDNNVRYITDQLQRIVEKLDGNDILVVYADHGEEFWEHQGFEHGHSLYDELLRVPLVVKAPGVRSGSKIDAPVSLLDVAPTVLELAGLTVPTEMGGKSLVPLLTGAEGAALSFEERDLAFGRPLYGADRWGVLHRHEKWTTIEGKETLFDVAADPGEKRNLLRKEQGDNGARYREYLGEALGRDVMGGYRLVPSTFRGNTKEEIPGLWVACTVPGGFSAAWKADDPLHNSEATVHVIPAEELREKLDRYGFPDHPVQEADQGVEICWHPGWSGSREVYIGPAKPLGEVGRELRCSAWLGSAEGGTRGDMVIPADRDPALGADRSALAKVNLDKRSVALEFGIAPVPDADTLELSGADEEMSEMLEALGYADGDRAPEPVDGDPTAPGAHSTPCVPPRP